VLVEPRRALVRRGRRVPALRLDGRERVVARRLALQGLREGPLHGLARDLAHDRVLDDRALLGVVPEVARGGGGVRGLGGLVLLLLRGELLAAILRGLG